MSNFECLGLPACGKSWVVQNILDCKDYKCVSISSLNKFLKGSAVFFGIVFHYQIVHKLYMIYLVNDKLAARKTISKLSVIFSRLGLLKIVNSAVVDEGPLQALWGAVWKMECNDKNLMLVSEIVNCITKEQSVIYIMSNKSDYKQRVASRARRHPFSFADQHDVKLGRKWLALILRSARKCTSVVLIKN
jgi:hypothetical protein